MNNKDIIRITFLCLCAAISASSLMIFMDPVHWRNLLAAVFIFTFCIGFSSIGLLYLFHNYIPRGKSIASFFFFFFLFIVIAVVGTELGYFIQYLLFGWKPDYDGQVHLLSLNITLTELGGSITAMYSKLQAKTDNIAKQLKEKEINEEKLLRLKVQAELDVLQAKINPHFLFNTLNSIASLILVNPDAAEATVEKLSELFRYTLQQTANSTVKLNDELEIIKSYLEIEKIRFGERLMYEIEIDPRLESMHIPALLIQPLVENSIKHCIAQEVDGGKITIGASLVGKQCRISVSDSGKEFKAMKEETGETGFGLRSIRERLRLMYGENASFNISNTENTRVDIIIPIS